jgi:Uncharacterized protein conserved in bacteria (DUF2171)
MADPVSWLVIERGWRVVDADGNEVGKVEETVGDSTSDIFNGLTIATGLLARGRYVAAEQVDEIVEGCVRLKLRGDEVERLPEYSEPPPQERIEPE